MAFILGVGCKISDTRGPIWMKLWGYLESTLRLCNVVFSTSGLVLKTGNCNFPDNPTLVPCHTFLRFLIFPKLKYPVFLVTPKTNAISKTVKMRPYLPFENSLCFSTTLKFYSNFLVQIFRQI